MEQDILITTDSTFDSIAYDMSTESWIFNFENNISLVASTLWRLLKDNQIILVSADHGHQFGLPEPLDVVNELSQNLKRQKLTNIQIKKTTGDLILTLTDKHELEVFISSGGFESYNLHVDNKQYIGMGMGDIAIFNKGK